MRGGDIGMMITVRGGCEEGDWMGGQRGECNKQELNGGKEAGDSNTVLVLHFTTSGSLRSAGKKVTVLDGGAKSGAPTHQTRPDQTRPDQTTCVHSLHTASECSLYSLIHHPQTLPRPHHSPSRHHAAETTA